MEIEAAGGAVSIPGNMIIGAILGLVAVIGGMFKIMWYFIISKIDNSEKHCREELAKSRRELSELYRFLFDNSTKYCARDMCPNREKFKLPERRENKRRAKDRGEVPISKNLIGSERRTGFERRQPA